MTRRTAVVSCATGHYAVGQRRLSARLCQMQQAHVAYGNGGDAIPVPASWPAHKAKPYAFKAYALKAAADGGFTMLLWADACIVPITQSLDAIWERAAAHGVWMSLNGYKNVEWTAHGAYKDLYPGHSVEFAKQLNANVQHVVGGAYAIDLTHHKGAQFFRDLYFFASETNAMCGPWTGGVGVQHRHDQTVMSVIAHRLSVPLTLPPKYFSYRGGETHETVLVADGAY